MVTEDEIQARLTGFAVEVLKLCECVPDGHAGKQLAHRLIRTGTAGAPAFINARAAGSVFEFIMRIGTVIRSLNEVKACLQTGLKHQLVPPEGVSRLIQECDALCDIICDNRRRVYEQWMTGSRQ